jgi:hypothetical protein
MREREQREAADEIQYLAGELRDLVAHEPLERADVRGEPAHELPRATLREKPG